MNHTPEPWDLKQQYSADSNGSCMYKITKQGDYWPIIPECSTGENFARIVACVNACAGMDDPAAEIERLRDMEKNIAPILQTVRSLAQQISGDKSIDRMTRLEALGLLMAIPAEKGINP
jgi:hypothetical protein